jgi:hypothetical protein
MIGITPVRVFEFGLFMNMLNYTITLAGIIH